MQEPDVIRRVHEHLLLKGLDGQPTQRLYTDAHPTLTGIAELRPFHRFALDYGDFAVHPDLVGQQADGESLFAIEAKGGSGVVAGIHQAQMYQRGVQRAFIAAPGSSLTQGVIEHARSRGVGVLAVGEDVEPIHIPEARMPLFSLYKGLLAEFTCLDWVRQAGTFNLNLPTHYLVWSIALQQATDYSTAEALAAVEGYRLPANGIDALRGAQKLGLVRHAGGIVRLTDAGVAAKDILPTALSAWNDLHARLVGARGRTLLHQLDARAGAVLRLLLLQDPFVRLITQGLERLPARRGSFDQLAASCSTLDAPRAMIFFLKPEATAARTAPHGQIDWTKVQPQDYRSTSFFQFKSVLRHAGLLSSASLGGASAVGYRPQQDVWALR